MSNKYSAVKNWLKQCPFFENFIFLNVIPDQSNAAAILTDGNSGIVSEFIDGSLVWELVFTVSIVRDYDTSTTDINAKAIGDFDEIANWIMEMNYRGELPDFGNYILVEHVIPYFNEPEIYISSDEKRARYQAKFVINYVTRR